MGTERIPHQYRLPSSQTTNFAPDGPQPVRHKSLVHPGASPDPDGISPNLGSCVFPMYGITKAFHTTRIWNFKPFTTTRQFSGSRKKCLKHYAPEIRRKNHGRRCGIIPRQISLEGGLPITIGFPDKFPKLPGSKNMVVSSENFELP